MKRTAAIVILSIIAVIAGITAVADVFRYMGWMFSPISFFGSDILGAILSGIVAAIWFSTAARVWNLDPRGWLFVVTIAVIFLIIDVLSIIGGTSIQFLLPSITASALALILGLLPSTRREFGTA